MKLTFPMYARKDAIIWSEECEIAHRRFFSEFNEKVWPSLSNYGFSKDTILLYWMLNATVVTVEDVVKALQEEKGWDAG